MHHQFSHPQFSYLSPLNMQCTAQVKNKVSHVSFALFTLLIFSPCSNSSVFHSHIFFFSFIVQALKNIAAISLAINYPNKSTKLLNMSPWEKGRRTTWRRGGNPLHSGNSAVLWTWAVEGYSKSTFHTYSQSFLPYVNPVYQHVHSLEQEQLRGSCFFSLFFFFVCSFVFLNKVFTWRCRAKGHEVCQIHDFQGEVYSFLSCLSSS